MLRSIAVCVLLAACAGPPARYDGGIASDGSSMSCQVDEAPRWGFEVRGADLVLHHDQGSLELLGVVPGDGVRYRVHDFATPQIDFELADARRAEWRGDQVLWDGETLSFDRR